jgi:polyhydroxyalkanoate synthesis regulator phasin
MVKQLPPRHKLTNSEEESQQLLKIVNQQTTLIKALVADVKELEQRIQTLENP